jgi:nucleoside 2-deoxyribosyltransferase
MTEILVYLAGPLFSDQDRQMLLTIESAFITAGMRCFLPHREVGDLSALKAKIGEQPARRYVFDSDVQGVKDCTVLCALLDGTDVDSGTAAEMGYAHAIGKPVFGLCTDGLRRGRTINNVIWGVCDEGGKIYASISEMVTGVMETLLRSGRTQMVLGQKSRCTAIPGSDTPHRSSKSRSVSASSRE